MSENHLKESKKKKQNRHLTQFNLFIILLIFFIIIAIAVPVTSYYLRMGKAREVLLTAKTVRLSIMTEAYDYFSEGTTIEDSSARNGLRDGAEEAVLSLAAGEGKVQYVDFDTKEMELNELVYIEDGYLAVYINNGKDNKGWNVYRLENLIKY